LRGGVYVNEIKEKIAEVTGLDSDTTVLKYLNKTFKSERKGGAPKGSEIKTASEVIASLGKSSIDAEYGESLVDRFRKEVLEEEKLSPEEKAKLEAERQQKRNTMYLLREELRRRLE